MRVLVDCVRVDLFASCSDLPFTAQGKGYRGHRVDVVREKLKRKKEREK